MKGVGQESMAQILDADRIAARVREVAREITAPEAARIDAKGLWPEATLRALLQSGLGALTVPGVHGGLDQRLATLARACEVLGTECASSALCYGMHCVGAAVLGARPTPSQVARYLTPICEGRHLTTLALSEPETGVHFYVPRTSAMPMPDGGYLLDGTKSFVTNGAHCDSYVVSVHDREAEGTVGRFSCVIVDRALPGMDWGAAWSGIGMRGNESRTLRLHEVELPQDALLGEEGEQIGYVFEILAPYFLAAMAGTYLGIAQAAFDEARRSLAARTYAHARRWRALDRRARGLRRRPARRRPRRARGRDRGSRHRPGHGRGNAAPPLRALLHHQGRRARTGLGLATCHDIVERAGGRIRAESRTGAGTRFTLVPPAAPDPERA